MAKWFGRKPAVETSATRHQRIRRANAAIAQIARQQAKTEKQKPEFELRLNGFLDMVREADGQIRVPDGVALGAAFGYSTTFNQDIYTAQWRLRRMSRDEYQKNPFFRRAVRMTQRNVIGTGVKCRPAPTNEKGELVDDAASELAMRWMQFGRRGMPDVTGRLTWQDIEYQAIFSMMVDGEFLAVIHNGGEHGLQLQVLEPWRLGADQAANKDRFMGVELTKFGKPKNYHILAPNYAQNISSGLFGSVGTGEGDMQVYPAARVIHLFDPEFPEQVRGYPPLATTVDRYEGIRKYEEDELTASGICANPIAFISPNEAGGTFAAPTDQDPNAPVELDTRPGAVNELKYGARLDVFDPAHPNNIYSEFVSAALRGAAAGSDVDHVTLTMDTRGVNFSTLRQFALTQRDVWKRWQSIVISGLHERVYSLWLDKQVVRKPLRAMELVDKATLGEVMFVPRTHEHIQPKEAATANQLGIADKTKTRSEVIRDGGRDPTEVFEELAWEQREAERLGLTLEAPKPAPPQPGKDPKDGDDGDDDGDDGDDDGQE